MKMDPTAPGSHVTHAQTAKISCATCHNGYTETSFNPVTHDNGFINLVFSGLATGATYSQGDTHPLGNGFGTCSALSCHGQGAPTWGATSNAPVNGFPYSATQCEKCHGSAATNPFYSTAIPKVATNTDAHTGAHTDHLAGTKNISSAIACLECHAVPATVTAAGHLDGTTQVAFVGTLAKANSSTATTCATTWCHGGNTTLIPQNSPARTAPTWGTRFPATSTLGTGGTVGTSGSGYCAQCHGYPPLTTSHAGKTAATCIGCHPHLNSDALTFNDKTKHIDGSIQAANGHSVPFDSHNAEIVAASGNTACLGCHTMGTSASVYPAAGGAAPNCMSCHKKAAPTHTGTTAGANCSSCHGTSTNSTATKKGIPTGAAFPDLRKGHSRGEHNVACTICHVLGTSGGTGSGINHGRGSTAGPVRDGKPNVVGTFVTGITVTGGGVKGASPTTVKCNHNLITGNGCNGNGTNETW
jgi:predicted CxxxxCH...CXXCH cytochrome family protein